MGLFKRIGEVFSANLNEVVDKFEDPERMLKQAIREMEAEIADATNSAAKALAGEKILIRQTAESEQEVENWQQRAEQAVEAGDDASARNALVRKREAEKLAQANRDQLVAAKDTSQTLKKQVVSMKEKHAEAKRKLGTLAARKKAADARAKKFQIEHTDSRVAADAFAKFDRMKEKVEMAEAQAEALAELHGGPVGDNNGFDRAASDKDMDIEAELAAMKGAKR